LEEEEEVQGIVLPAWGRDSWRGLEVGVGTEVEVDDNIWAGDAAGA